MSNFPKAKTDNLGGVRKFEFIASNNVLSIPIPVNAVISASIPLKSGSAFLEGYATAKTLLFEEKNKLSNAGTSFLQEISGFYPGNTPEIIDFFSNMLRHNYIIKITDSNNYLRLVGTLESPLVFAFDLSTEAAVPKRPGIKYSFFAENILPAPFLTPIPA